MLCVGGERRAGDDASGDGFEEPGEGERQRGFAGTVRTDERGDLPGAEREVDVLGDGVAAPAYRQVVGRKHGFACAVGRFVCGLVLGADARDLVFGAAEPIGHPDAELREVECGVGEHRFGCAVGHDHGVAERAAVDLLFEPALLHLARVVFGFQSEHDDAVDHVDPPVGAVLDEHHRRTGSRQHITHGADDLRHAVGVEVGGRLVEQQHARLHRERAGQGEPLHLAAAQVHDRAVELQAAHAHRVECGVDARPDLLAWHVEVFRTERHIVSETLEDGLRLRILQHESHGAARGMCFDAANEDLAFGDAAVRVFDLHAGVLRRGLCGGFVAEQAGHAFEDRGFADAGSAQQQDALAGIDREVELAHGEMVARGMPIAPVAELYRSGMWRGCWSGHGCCVFLCGGGYADAPARLAGASELVQRVRLRTMRPEAKLSSAPVLAMPM